MAAPTFGTRTPSLEVVSVNTLLVILEYGLKMIHHQFDSLPTLPDLSDNDIMDILYAIKIDYLDHLTNSEQNELRTFVNNFYNTLPVDDPRIINEDHFEHYILVILHISIRIISCQQFEITKNIEMMY